MKYRCFDMICNNLEIDYMIYEFEYMFEFTSDEIEFTFTDFNLKLNLYIAKYVLLYM